MIRSLILAAVLAVASCAGLARVVDALSIADYSSSVASRMADYAEEDLDMRDASAFVEDLAWYLSRDPSDSHGGIDSGILQLLEKALVIHDQHVESDPGLTPEEKQRALIESSRLLQLVRELVERSQPVPSPPG